MIVSSLLPLFLTGLDLTPASVPVEAPATAARDLPSPKVILAQAPASIKPATPPAVASPDRASIIDRAGKALGGVKTAQGKFTQSDDLGGASSGAFYINRPGKVRFEYTKPEPMFIVSDGVSVSIEEPRRDAYDAVPLASTPLNLFLRGTVDLRRDGSVVDVKSTNGSHFVTLEDRTGEAEGQMVLEFRASDFELLGWTSIDGTGAQTRVRLTETRTNVKLQPTLFIVKDPADAADDRR